jgi:RimJ/RimL family protein N-acetyltransferase
MSGPTAAQAATIEALKAGEAQAAILVLGAGGATLGRIEPITRAMAEDQGLHAALSCWRAASMRAFLTVFESTPEKTGAFLTRVSIPAPSRLLCLLRDAEGTPVGNIGLCNISEHSAELDNVLRGEAAAPGFMRAATRAYLDWAFRTLDLREIYLHVLEDNARAVGLYEAVGFARGARLPLWRRDTAEGYELLRADAEGATPFGTRLLRMTLSPADLRAT